MPSIIKLTPFSGVMGESPTCYLLQVDEFRFMLDCGWDEHFSMEYIDELKSHISQIDAVLLSHSDHSHLGALPYLVGKCGLSCPIYATVPVYKMGQMFMYDLYQSRHNFEDFSLFTLDDVDAAFDKIQQVKYSQQVSMKGKGHGLSITALPAGHLLGGSIWRIVKDGDEDIVYAVDYNHKKERHLNGCILDTITKPCVLITDAFNAAYEHERRKKRDELLLTNIVQTLRGSGDVLLAVDTAGRVLELFHLLDQLWQAEESGLVAYSLVFLSNVSYNVLEFAKSQVEWMSEKIQKSFEDIRNNPFSVKHLQLCHTMQEVKKVPSPKVVLASVADMECGFSREMFLTMCRSSKNTVILTQRSSPGTLARTLIDNPKTKKVVLEVRSREPLRGDELTQYLAEQRAKEDAAAAVQRHLNRSLDSSSSDSEEDEVAVDSFPHTVPQVLKKWGGRGKGLNFIKNLKRTHLMYPYAEPMVKWDEYGEVITPSDFIIKEIQDGADHLSTLHDRDVSQTAESAAKKRKVTKSESEHEPQEVPMKSVSATHQVDVNAQVVFIDFEGRSDGESIRRIVATVQPKELVLVHGAQGATEDLAKYYRSHGIARVATPKLHETVDVSTESQMYQIRLTDTLLRSLTFGTVSSARSGGARRAGWWWRGRSVGTTTGSGRCSTNSTPSSEEGGARDSLLSALGHSLRLEFGYCWAEMCLEIELSGQDYPLWTLVSNRSPKV